MPRPLGTTSPSSDALRERHLDERHTEAPVVDPSDLDAARIEERLLDQLPRDRRGLAAGSEVDRLDQRLRTLLAVRLGEPDHRPTERVGRAVGVVAVVAAEAGGRHEERAGVVEATHRGVQRLHPAAQCLAPGGQVVVGEVAVVVEGGQPVDAGDRRVGVPRRRPGSATHRSPTPGSRVSTSAPALFSCFTSASPTPPSSSITTTRAPSSSTPVGRQLVVGGRSDGTGIRRGSASTASKSPWTTLGARRPLPAPLLRSELQARRRRDRPARAPTQPHDATSGSHATASSRHAPTRSAHEPPRTPRPASPCRHPDPPPDPDPAPTTPSDTPSSPQPPPSPAPTHHRPPDVARAGDASGCRRVETGAITHPLSHMTQRREVTQLQVLVTLQLVVLTNRREHLGLLHRVDTQIRLQIQIRLQQLRRIPRHLRNHRRHLRQHIINRQHGRDAAAGARSEPRLPARRDRPDHAPTQPHDATSGSHATASSRHAPTRSAHEPPRTPRPASPCRHPDPPPDPDPAPTTPSDTPSSPQPPPSPAPTHHRPPPRAPRAAAGRSEPRLPARRDRPDRAPTQPHDASVGKSRNCRFSSRSNS